MSQLHPRSYPGSYSHELAAQLNPAMHNGLPPLLSRMSPFNQLSQLNALGHNLGHHHYPHSLGNLNSNSPLNQLTPLGSHLSHISQLNHLKSLHHSSTSTNSAVSLSTPPPPTTPTHPAFHLYNYAYQYAMAGRRKSENLENLQQSFASQPPPLISNLAGAGEDACSALDLSKSKPTLSTQQLPPPLKEKRPDNKSASVHRLPSSLHTSSRNANCKTLLKPKRSLPAESSAQSKTDRIGHGSNKSAATIANCKRQPSMKKPTRRLQFDEHKSSPVSGTVIVTGSDDEDQALLADADGEYCKSADIDPSLNIVEATPEARAELEKIVNHIGDYVCQLCTLRFEDAFGLAQHRCSCIRSKKYRCPECEKLFNCPANLASHRRWHRPNARSNSTTNSNGETSTPTPPSGSSLSSSISSNMSCSSSISSSSSLPGSASNNCRRRSSPPIRPASTGSLVQPLSPSLSNPRPVSSTPIVSTASVSGPSSPAMIQLKPKNMNKSVPPKLKSTPAIDSSTSPISPPPLTPQANALTGQFEMAALTKVTVAGQPIELSVTGVGLSSELYNLSIASGHHQGDHHPRRLPHKVKVNGTAFIPELSAVAPISNCSTHTEPVEAVVGGEAPNSPATRPSSPAVVPNQTPVEGGVDGQNYCPKKFRRLAYLKKSSRQEEGMDRSDVAENSSDCAADSLPKTGSAANTCEPNQPEPSSTEAASQSTDSNTSTEQPTEDNAESVSESNVVDVDDMLESSSALDALAAEVLSGSLVQRKKRALSVTSEEDVKAKLDFTTLDCHAPVSTTVSTNATNQPATVHLKPKSREIKKIKSEAQH